MKLKNRILLITSIIIAVVAVLFALTKPFSIQKESEEGQLFTEACDDIKAYETLRAESDLDMALEVILTHIQQNDALTDSVVGLIQTELMTLKDEMAFHYTNQDYYHQGFMRVLFQLSYLELQNTKKYLEENRSTRAMESLIESEHYLHDALTFSAKKKKFDAQLEILRKMKQMNKNELSIAEITNLISETEALM